MGDPNSGATNEPKKASKDPLSIPREITRDLFHIGSARAGRFGAHRWPECDQTRPSASISGRQPGKCAPDRMIQSQLNLFVASLRSTIGYYLATMTPDQTVFTATDGPSMEYHDVFEVVRASSATSDP